MANLLYGLISLNKLLGRCSALLALLMAVGTLTIVVLRYGWGIGAVGLQESVLYAFATLWWLCAPLTLSEDGHVRVDIFYRQYRLPTRRRINLIGHCCLLIPTCLLLPWLSWRYVVMSWTLKEGSTEPGGLPLLYLLKSLLVVGPALLCLHAVLLALLCLHEEVSHRRSRQKPK